jgi:hypothetical protein
VELVAALPVLGVALLVAVQLAIVGYAFWSAGVAARAGARAAYVGGDGERAARQSLPPGLRNAASVHAGGGVTVRVRSPSVVPGLPKVPVTARAGLGAGDGD